MDEKNSKKLEKKRKILDVVGYSSLAAGVICMVGFYIYDSIYNSKPEIQLLKGTAAYVEEYQGKNPQKVLDYTRKTLEITKSIQPEKIKNLEEKIKRIEDSLNETNPDIYQPVLKELSYEIKEVIPNPYDKLGIFTLIPTLCLSIGTISFLLSSDIYLEQMLSKYR